MPAELAEALADYLRQLKKELELAADVAELTASKKQEPHATQYNKHATVKTFSEEDTVLVFDDKRPGKMFPKWLGPCTVKGRYREHSYYVQTREGRRLLVHANRLRPYLRGVAAFSVMFHDNSDFGDVEYTPRTVKPEQANVGVAPEKTAHLDDAIAARVRGVFEIHKALFEEKQGIANVGEHCIKLFEGASPKRGHPYRIPEALKGDVSKQIE